MNRKLVFVLLGVLVLGIASGLLWSVASFNNRTKGKVVVEQDASYAFYTREEMIDHAGAIFLGKVVGFSPTRWNQDDGQEWNDNQIGGDSGIQIYQVYLEVIQPIVDSYGLDSQVTVTCIGRSPLDDPKNNSLQAEEQGIYFMEQTHLAWREGKTRQIFEFIGDPTNARLRLQDDGLYLGTLEERPLSLKEIIQQIAQRRTVPGQP